MRRVDASPGILCALEADAERLLEAVYRPGRPWVFDTRGDAADPWYEANCAAMAAFVAWVGGDATLAEVRKRGLFGAADALAFERRLCEVGR